MARKIITCPQAPDIMSNKNSKIFTIYVVTPLFGGGVEAGKNDPVTVIRGTSIRGQLRFWWRATMGAKYSSIIELKEAEGKIWGTTDIPGPVSIAVKIENQGQSEACASIPPGKSFSNFNKGYPSYALFPFGGNKQQQPSSARKNIVFKLTVTWERDELKNEVMPALWAWVNFGGLGARTRRGCGSLFCKELAPPASINLKDWYKNRLQEFNIKIDNQIRPWPTLGEVGKIKVNMNKTSPIETWNRIIEILRIFRQGQNVGRNPGSDPTKPFKLGRSRWPEADSLRRITGMSNRNHENSITTDEDAFPRAEFGMPVIFHFISPGDPVPDAQLLPEGDNQRMASPIILKPLCTEQDQAYPFIMLLKTVKLKKARVIHDTDEYPIKELEIRRTDLSAYNNSPMKGRTKNGSAIEAFMKFAEEEGYR